MTWILGLLLSLSAAAGTRGTADRPPNVLFILADDLGLGDVGAYGQQRIRTPAFDRLAREGLRLTRHYSGNAVCAPSRCVLMTGLHPGHAPLRDNREVQPEGQWPLPASAVTLPRLLQTAGYVTGAFGKWGMGAPGSEGAPLRQGFDRFYGYNCQRQAHNHYPAMLWDDDRQVALRNPAFPAHQKLPAGADASDPAVYARYRGEDYAPDLIAEQALAFIDAHRDRPFFLYFATTVPHLALQVPEDSLAAYRGQFPDPPYRGDSGYLPHPAPRAAYAAMISRFDRDVGRMLERLDRYGLAEETIVVFTSDNGPLYDRLGGTDTEFFGSAAGLRGRKGALHEGGLRVPGLVRWVGHVPPGSTADRVTGFEDWLPTLLELAGLGERVPAGLDGLSFAPTLLGRTQRARPYLYREFPGYGGWQMMIEGSWKIVRRQLTPRAAAPDQGPVVELFRLDRDPTESVNLADRHPRRVERLVRRMEQHRVPAPDFPFAALDRR